MKCTKKRIGDGEVNELMQYIRVNKKNNTRGQKVGIMVALVDPNDPTRIGIGYSKCKVRSKESEVDRFDREIGLNLARERAIKWIESKHAAVVSSTETIQSVRKKRQEKINHFISREMPAPEFVSVLVPQTIQKQFTDFIMRSSKYFKDLPLPPWAQPIVDKINSENEKQEEIKKDAELGDKKTKFDSVEEDMSGNQMVSGWT